MATAQEEFDELMREKGHRSTHPEDDNDATSFLNLSDSYHEDDANGVPEDDNPRPSMSAARNTIPLTRYEANTGPKGVIADAQHFRDSRRLHRVSMRSNGVAAPGSKSIPLGPTLTEKVDGDDEVLEEFDDGEWDGDDEFMRTWRMGRLKQLQSAVVKNGGSSAVAAAHPRAAAMRSRIWGGLTPVDGSGYLDAIDGSPKDTVVVVYIYDDESEVSLAIEEWLREIALKHLDVRFIKLHFEDAEMEPAGVPALLAYRAGDKFAGLVPVIQEIPDDAEVSARTLELLLKRSHILR